MKKFLRVLAIGFLLVLFVPVLIAQIWDSEPRSFESANLSEMTFREVGFRNEEQNLDLAGMLFVPDGEGPFPGAVIIHGSGTSRRENGWYLTLTKYLQEHGIAVLLPDKRGSERSGGDWRTASFEDLATDTVAAVEYLKNQADVAVAGIGVIGMSQGGHIAPLVADRTEDLAFVVNVVGGAMPMHDSLVYEETHNLRELGVLPVLSDALAYPSAWSIRAVRQKAFWDVIGNFDPAPYWREMSIPALVLYGEDDTNVPTRRSAELLRSLGKRNIDVRVYEGSGHALESPEGEGDSIFREDALGDIVEFVEWTAPAKR